MGGGAEQDQGTLHVPPTCLATGPAPEGVRRTPSLAPATVIDHFKIVRLLGKGGMGEVYLARDLKLGRRVALKLILADTLASSDAVERFLFEARTTAEFSHPHIVTVYYVGQYQGRPYVALEYIEGSPLRDRLRSGPLGVKESIRIALAIAEALAEAHAHGVLHRDLKPENVLIGHDGRVRVVDFGLAKRVQTSATSEIGLRDTLGATVDGPRPFESRGEIKGTPLYMAPEQWRSGTQTPAVDAWALGVVLYELLSGSPPYDATRLHAHVSWLQSAEPCAPLRRPDVPVAVAQLLARCLDKDPAQRPAAAEVAAQLAAVLQGEPASSREGASAFRGLLPFSEQHASQFFGRADEVAQFVERLRDEPTLAVVGPSGAGKSSFVAAGVIPRLKEQNPWLALVMRPGRRPFEALALRLARADSSNSSAPEERQRRRATDLATLLRTSPGRLALELAELADRSQKHVLLVVDQLEEMHTLVDDPAERAAFLEAACLAADDPELPVRVVTTLRDDFLGRMGESPRVRDALGRMMLLRAPGPAALQDLLERTVRHAGYAFDDAGLVGDIVQGVHREPAALALVQLVGEALWERRDGSARLLTRASFEALGGVEGALAARAGAALHGLTAEQMGHARHVLLRLVTPEGTRRSVPHGTLLDGLPDDARHVLDRLVAERTVQVRRSRRLEAEAEVELAHESLVTHWGTLRRWREESREELAFRAELCQAADLWRRRGSSEDEVWRGDILADARRRARQLDDLPAEARAFLAAGDRLERRRRRLRRGLATTALVALAVVALVLVIQNRSVRTQRNEVVRLQRRTTEEKATALREAAEGALREGNAARARAMLRAALEAKDSIPARAAWNRALAEPILWRSLHEQIRGGTWSTDGSRLLVALGGPVAIHDVESGRSLDSRLRLCVDVQLSQDGARIATIGSVASVYEASSMRELAALPLAGDRIRFTRSPDRLLVYSRRELLLWKPGAEPEPIAEGVDDFRLARSSDVLVMLADGVLSRSAPAHGAGREEVPAATEGLRAMALSDDGHWLSLGKADGTIELWDLARPTRVEAWVNPGGDIGSMEFAPDGKELAVVTKEGRLNRYSIPAASLTGNLALEPGALSLLSYAPDGGALALGYRNGLLVLVDLHAAPRRPSRGHDTVFLAGAVGTDGRIVASASRLEDRPTAILLWDGRSGAAIGSLGGHQKGVAALAFAPRGSLLASGSFDDTVRLWDADTRRLEGVLAVGSPARQLAFTPDGSRLVVAARQAQVWQLAERRLVLRLDGHEEMVTGLGLAPDGKEIATLDQAGTLRTWDARTGRRLLTLPGIAGRRPRPYSQLAYRPDGSGLALGRPDGTILVVDRTSGAARPFTRVAPIEGHVEASFPGLFYAAGGTILGVLGTGTFPRVLLDMNGEERFWALNHSGHGTTFAVSADSRRLIGDDGAAIRMWDLETGRPIWSTSAFLPAARLVRTHLGWLSLDGGDVREPPASRWKQAIVDRAGVAVGSLDGRRLCLLTRDGTVEMWDLEKDTLLAEGHGASALVPPKPWRGGCFYLGPSRSFAQQSYLLIPGQPPVRLDAADERGRRWTVDDDGKLRARDADGRELSVMPLDEEAVKTPYDGGFVITDNTVALAANGEADSDLTLPVVDRSQLVNMLFGPGGTLVTLHEDGFVGVWHIESRRLIDSMKLHGIPFYSFVADDRLYVATQIGDHAVLDLGVLTRERCQLLREIWARSPLVWQENRTVHAEPPGRHPCAPR